MHVRQLLLTLITLCLPPTQLPKRVGATLSSNNTDTTHQPAADWKANAMRCLKNTPLPTPYQSADALAAAAVVFVYLFRRELLRVSAGRGYLLPVKLLITCGVDVNAYSKKCVGDFGHSAFFLAAKNGHTAVVAYLLGIKNVKKNGFWDEETKTVYSSPLLEACANEHFRVIELLLQDKAVSKIPLVLDENLYHTPLMLCCLYANKVQSVKPLGLLFIKHMTEQEINYFTKEGKKTALDYAIENGDEDILNALKEKNAKKYAELHISNV